MTLTEINALDREAFVSRYGALFEHSPWVVERAADRRPFDDAHGGLMGVLAELSREEKVSLIRAHPELAGRASVDRTLTQASASEQASAGLDRLTPGEYELFHSLNTAYRERFGFPFVVCAREHTADTIIAAARERLRHDPDAEERTALAEIAKIAALRLDDLVEDRKDQ